MFTLVASVVVSWLFVMMIDKTKTDAPKWCRGGGTTIEAPNTPQPQTTAESMADYVASLPALYQAQMQYEPLMQQMNLNMLQQYGTQYGQAMKNINDTLYPETAALQEQLATKASEGMSGEVPQWAKDAYRSELSANLGTNAGSPIGADYASRGMLQQQKDWQDYYTNLGLSVAGRQPLATGGTTGQTNYMQGYQPQQALNYNANTYGSYSNAYSSMYNTNAQMAQQGNPYFNAVAGVGGSILGGAAGAGGGIMKNIFG